MKKSFYLLAIGLFCGQFGCQKSENNLPQTRLETAPADPTALDEFIKTTVLQKGEFRWEWATDAEIWTAISNSDFVLAVGWKPAAEKNVACRLHEIDLNSPDWQAARQAVLTLALESERQIQPDLTAEKLLAFAENGSIPVFNFRVRNATTIAVLRKNDLVRYAEPAGYEPFMKNQAIDRSGSGCDSNGPEPGLVNNVDYTIKTPHCKAGWNHPSHKISEAWANSSGAGIKIQYIDTGVSFAQENLDEAFNQGESTGRTMERLVTLPQATNIWGNPIGLPETPDDGCGHGTSMIGAGAAPRGTDGATVGIAYNCDVISVRAAADVYLDESREVVGVSAAFTNAGNNNSVKIISMSMGRVTSSGQISDAIKYAHGKGKMIFCAAGTSFWWTSWFWGVIFPASMTEAIAVTGQKSNGSSACGNCHSGSKVDFTLLMEKVDNGRTPLSLAMDGDDPSTVGGSSVATASTAAIAALVWSKYPSWTRTQVFTRLKTSGNYYPNKHGSFGWGRVNAQAATQ